MSNKNLRLLDANLNRLREGIRVVEDIFRYVYDNKQVASKLKALRHQSRVPYYNELLSSRDIQSDVLKVSTVSEQSRQNLEAVVIANFKRAQESARVLEEISKVDTTQRSEKFKSIRYELYHLEKSLHKPSDEVTNTTSNSR